MQAGIRYGKPCKHGHGADEGRTLRRVSNSMCIECERQRTQSQNADAIRDRRCPECGEGDLPAPRGRGTRPQYHPQCLAVARRRRDRQRYAANPLPIKRASRAYTMGITLSQLDALYAKFDSSCGVCGTPEGDLPDRIATLCIDHDHRCCPGPKSCGECVRGLLCRRCNSLLTLTDDVTLAAIARYLEGR